MTTTWRWVLSVAGLLTCMAAAHGYVVGPALSLEALSGQADIIFKGTAVASGMVPDDGFTPHPGLVGVQTQFKVVSLVKGENTGNVLAFRHYDLDPQTHGYMFAPQHYHFEPGRTYIVFARKNGVAGVFRQLWDYQKIKQDQGVVLCADDKPAVRGPSSRSSGPSCWPCLQTDEPPMSRTRLANSMR